MERDNFFLLLDLSVDPPENKIEAIEAAIKAKQTQWSRLRNHPTKAVEAKKNIGLIPEMRKVMTDADLRGREAEQARKLIGKKEEDRFVELDRHLTIRMSKGYITEEEIFKLAKLHGLEDQEIRQRIQHMQKSKFSEIDKHLAIRMNKGYITEAEIERLAKMHNLGADVIRKRVKGPIRKGGEAKSGRPKPLDSSIQKLIGDNLKLVGKSSLYKFLGLPSSASLEEINKRVRKKESDIRKSGKKDAVVTASSVLVGQCLSIFKNEQTRQAYDITRAQSHLARLNSDIDVAGMDGVIRAEYFDTLVKTAVDLGMDQDEAGTYIREYCERKKWSVEETPVEKSKRFTRLLGIAAALLVVAVIAGTFWYLRSAGVKREYQRLLVQVEDESQLEAKVALLKKYIRTHDAGTFTPAAEEKMKSLGQAIVEREYRKIVAEAEKLKKAQAYEEAQALYQQYLQDGPGTHSADVNKKIKSLAGLMETRDYEKLTAMVVGEPMAKMDACLDYLQRYPEGRNDAKVLNMIAEMREEYYLAIEEALASCANQQDWDTCIQLCANFVHIYKDDPRSVALMGRQDGFQKKKHGQRILGELTTKAQAHGDDFDAAQKVFRDYLQAYPDSYIRADIEAAVVQIEKQKQQALAAAKIKRLKASVVGTGGRFSISAPEVVKDTRSGLMWCLVDSALALDRCLDYAGAQAYVKSLTTGGFRDWRLPTAAELGAIYKTEPFFPTPEPTWHWSADSHKRYADGWKIMVDTVTSRPETTFSKQQRDAVECGTVRAVRP